MNWAKKVLDYNPFDGDFGTSADKCFEDKIVGAVRVEHTCHECAQTIPAGERDTRLIVWLFDGEIHRYRICHLCCDAMALSWEDNGCAIDKRYKLRKGPANES